MEPRSHQTLAISKAVKHFKTQSRGKLIHPTGVGKSLTALWISEAIKSKVTLVVVPSIALIAQTLKDWKRELPQAKFIAVCSDSSVGEDDVTLDQSGIDVEVSTDPARLKAFLKLPGRKVVFSTYQSGEVVKKAVKDAVDFAIFDEAHKTAGEHGLFSLLLNDSRWFKVPRRLFMTATERHFKGTGNNVVSMDDESLYGGYIDQMSFKKAIEDKLICDYRIVTVKVTKREVARYIAQNKGVGRLQARSAVALLAYEKAKKDYGIKRAISFHSSVASAQAFTEAASQRGLMALHVNGKMPSSERNEVLTQLKNNECLVSNARCLTEGVDAPNVDAVVFADSKGSKIDIVQAVGRALRLNGDKNKMAYVIVPIDMSDESKQAQSFKRMVDVIGALAESDERIVDDIKIRSNGCAGGGDSPTCEIKDGPIEMAFRTLSESMRITLVDRVRRLVGFYTLEELRDKCISLGIDSIFKYHDWRTADTRAPSRPSDVYADWQDWYFLFGKHTKRSLVRYTYLELAELCKRLGIGSQKEYQSWCKSDPRAVSDPRAFYAEWVNWADLLGKSEAAKYTYSELRNACKASGIRTKIGYHAWQKTDPMAPSNPNTFYAEWISWPLLLGSNRPPKRKYSISMVRLMEFVAKDLRIKSKLTYRKFRRKSWPSCPYEHYPEWVSWPHFLGKE